MNDWLSYNRLLIIGHRGASTSAPENTLAAISLAAEQGADGVEFDVQLSADGYPIIMHDDTVDRTTNGTGVVTTLTLAELKQLDAGEGQQIPTLDEIFEQFSRHLLYNVELKLNEMDNRPNEGIEAAVADCIQRHNLAHRVLVSSFDAPTVQRAQQLMPAAVLIGLLREPQQRRDLVLQPLGQADHPCWVMVDEAYMAWARQHNLRVHVWTVDDPAEAQRLIDLGVHGLITNNPGHLRSAITENLRSSA
jgi:glycerophosphoryl diester phosphodiesterase